MSPIKRIAGLALIGLGLLLALFPFISVWRASGEVLDRLPLVPGAEVTEERHRVTAMFEENFELARRTYTAVSSEDVADALSADGFDQSTRSSRWGDEIWSKECCGAYDAMWVTLDEGRDGQVVAVLTMADNDVQISWPILVLLGGGPVVIGMLLIALSRSPSAAALNDERPLADLEPRP